MTQVLEFKQVKTHLAALYREGRLTPFIGLGMSLPTCTSWKAFLRQLAVQADLKNIPSVFGVASESEPSAEECYRLAETLTMLLKARQPEGRDGAYRAALKATDRPMLPLQTVALARLQWPLVLTTNYDDLYWAAAQGVKPPPENQWGEWQPAPSYRLPSGVNIVGRNLPDCHRVLRSLSEPTRPILWALQGYLGGQCAASDVSIPSKVQRDRLAQEVVVGHQQYQRAIHAVPHFRRAFGEVFRRRSLLFLGSGLMESYLINLFSETLYHQGPGAYPHFALLQRPKDGELGYDAAFLQSRLGIVPVFYDDHKELPGLLEALREEVAWPSDDSPKPDPNYAQLEELTFALRNVRITVRRGRIETAKVAAATNHAVVLSAGRGLQQEPVLGSQARILNDFLPHTPETLDAVALDAQRSTFRLGTSPLYIVVARKRREENQAPHDNEKDRRDLEVIAPAVRATLEAVARGGFTAVHVLPVAAGPKSPWHPVHSFAQVVRGVRDAVMGWKEPEIEEIILYVDHPGVWYPLVAGKIPVARILSSNLWSYTIDISDGHGDSEVLSVTSTQQFWTVREVLSAAGLTNLGAWEISLDPPPPAGTTITPTTVVVPTMTLVVRPK